MKRLLLFLLLLPTLVLAVSSDEASYKANLYLGDDSDVYVLTKPLSLGYESYWAFFYPLGNSKKIVVAVSFNDGTVVEDRATLSEIASAIYDYRVIQDDLKKNDFGLEFLDPTVKRAAEIAAQNEADLAYLNSQTKAKYPDFAMDGLEQDASAMSSKFANAQEKITESREWEKFTEETFEARDIQTLLFGYNDSFADLYDATLAFESFRKAVAQKQKDLQASEIPDPENTQIFNSLEALKDVSLGDVTSARMDNALKLVEFRESEKPAWVNDSVNAFFFRKTRYDALRLYNELLPEADAAKASAASIERCGAGQQLTELENKWAQIEYLKSFESEAAFENMLKLLQESDVLLKAIKSKTNACGGGLIKPPGETQIDVGWVVIVIAVFALGYALLQYKKKKDEENQSGGKDYY